RRQIRGDIGPAAGIGERSVHEDHGGLRRRLRLASGESGEYEQGRRGGGRAAQSTAGCSSGMHESSRNRREVSSGESRNPRSGNRSAALGRLFFLERPSATPARRTGPHAGGREGDRSPKRQDLPVRSGRGDLGAGKGVGQTV